MHRINPQQEQDNKWSSSWPDFWAECRIGELVRRSGDNELQALEAELRTKVYPLLFSKEAMRNVRPTIIHGDLWSGNSGTDQESGQPIIFDPSSSYSHNEAELGIMKMFGGYNNDFFDAYHEVIPKAQPHYDQRIDMYEAYHHLNHFVIFGGGYRAGTVQLFKKLISWAEREGQNPGADDGDDTSKSSSGALGLRGGSKIQPDVGLGPEDVRSPGFPSSKRSPPSPSNNCTTLADSEPSLATAAWQAERKRAVSSSTSTMVPTQAQISDFFSQMICYVWFSNGPPSRSRPCTPSRSPVSAHQPLQSSPLAPRRHAPNGSSRVHRSHHKMASTGGLPSTSASQVSVSAGSSLSKAMQNHLISSAMAQPGLDQSSSAAANDPITQCLQPTGKFLRFAREMLGTTQLSTSVITLALIYVTRLKGLHPHLKGREGSEYRVAISALMLANKILDDNTYLNKTWAEISGMPLVEISKMEVEFWLGLKMEVHVSKDDYDVGLQDLQLLANKRTRAIREREEVLKRFASQQQQQQQQAYIQQAALYKHLQQQHGVPLSGAPIVRQSHPYMHPRWSTSSDGVAPIHPSLAMHTFPSPAMRHSVGNGEGLMFPMHRPNAPHTRPTSPEALPVSSYSYISPPHHGTSYTMPSSPLSQGSGVPSLATTSNEAVSSLSEVEVATPQDLVYAGAGPFFAPDNVFQSFAHHNVPGQAAAVSGFVPQDEPADVSPSSTLQSYSQAQDVFRRQHSAQQMYASQQQHASSFNGLNGLKYDFENAKLASVSPNETRTLKRSAGADPLMEQEHRRRQRLSSAGAYSPSDHGALRNKYTTGSSPLSGPHDTQHHFRYAPHQHRASVSPSYSAPFLCHLPSPSHLTPLPRAQSATVDEIFQRQHPQQQVGMATSSGSAATRPSSMGGPSSAYYSVFSNALTPNALTAPLDLTHGGAGGEPARMSKMPLKYYSLAAGEAHGNLGSVMPPSHNTYGSNHPAGQQRFSLTPVFDPAGHYASNTVAADGWQMQANANQFVARGRLSQKSQPWEQRRLSLGKTVAHPNPAYSPFAYPTAHVGGMGPAAGVAQQQHQQHPPPFAMDPQGWPLMNSSAASYVFPYHLIPTSSTQDRGHFASTG